MGVRAQARCGCRDALDGARHPHRIPDVVFDAYLRMLERDDEPALEQMRIGVMVIGAHHRHRRNTVGLQKRRGSLGVAPDGPGAQPRAERLGDVEACCDAVERRVVFPAECRLEPEPGGVIGDGDGDPAIVTGRGVDAVRSARRRFVPPHRMRVDDGARVGGTGVVVSVEVHLADEVRRSFGLGHVDQLALAGAVAVGQRGQQCHREHLAGDVVGMVQRGAAGERTVAIAPQVHEPGEACVEWSVRGHLRVRTSPAVALRRDIDHRRVHRAYVVVTETRAIENRAAVVLGHDVSGRAERMSEVTAFVGREIDRHTCASPTLGVEGEGLVDLAAGGAAQYVGVSDRLDLDDLGAEFGQHTAHLGHHGRHAELDHAEPVEQQRAVVPAESSPTQRRIHARHGVDRAWMIERGRACAIGRRPTNRRRSSRELVWGGGERCVARCADVERGEEAAASGLLVCHELEGRVHDADGRAAPHRLGEHLGARAVGEAFLGDDAHDVGVHEPEPCA